MKYAKSKGAAVQEQLNSNIGCFEIFLLIVAGNFRNQLNSNIGCFEMKNTPLMFLNLITLNSNVGCFEIQEAGAFLRALNS